jgi:outer membrane immunogenic protein
MKTVATFAFIALYGLCARTYAGPEAIAPASGKEMKEVAMQAPSCASWTGFYVGGFGAWEYGVFDPHVDVAFEDETEDAREVESQANDHNLSASGAELGGLIGYNYQWRKWVFGLEGEGGYLWLRNSQKHRFPIPGSDDIYAFAPSIKSHYLFTLGGRVGYSFCKWLPYVTGGLALGDADLEQRISETGDWSQTRNDSGTQVGWFVGGGLQYMLCKHWSVRGQYQYIDLGSVDLSYRVPTEFRASSNMDVRQHNVSFAVIYGF